MRLTQLLYSLVAKFIMVIELSGVQFGLKSYVWFQNLRARSIWNYKYDFRPKLLDTKFNYDFIKAILKSQLSVRFKTEVTWFRTWMTRFITDVICSKKYRDLWINHTAESHSDCRDHQWFQNGYNKIHYEVVLGCLLVLVLAIYVYPGSMETTMGLCCHECCYSQRAA